VIDASGFDTALDIPRELPAKNQILGADRAGRPQERNDQPQNVEGYPGDCSRQLQHALIMPESPCVCRPQKAKFPRRELLRTTDHDPLFRFHRWLANLRVLEIEEIKSVPYAPVSHPFVERLIGTLRREYLDRMFFWNALDLTRKLGEFREYYNAHRVHRALAGSTPVQCAGAPSPAAAALEHYAWQQHCRGLFHTPIAA